MRKVIVTATARGDSWDAPLRGWIEQRARSLRDRAGVEDVRIVESALPSLSWEIRLDLRQDPRADTALRELLADLELLNARPLVQDYGGG